MHAIDVAADLLQHLSDVCRTDENGRRVREHLSPPRPELRPAAQRVLELGAVRLHGVARSGRLAHRTAEQNVVAEDEIGGKLGSDGGGVRLHPRVKLRTRAVLQELHLVPFVAVAHEHGKQTADIRPNDARGAQVVQLRVRLLAEDDNLVPGPAPFPGERPRVDVRPSAAEQVAMPEDNLHGFIVPDDSGCDRSTWLVSLAVTTHDEARHPPQPRESRDGAAAPTAPRPFR